MRQTSQPFKLHTSYATLSGDIYTYRLTRPIEHVYSIAIKRAIIPFSYYVFSDNTGRVNNIITFDEGGAPLTATITPKNYNSTELETEIKTRLDAAGGQVYTVSIDTDSYKVTISAAGNFSLDFTGDDSPFCELGFEQTTYGPSTSITSPNAGNFNGPLSLFIRSNELSIGSHAKTVFRGDTSNVICGVPIAVLPGQIIDTFYYPSEVIQYVSNRPTKDGTYLSQDSKNMIGKTIREIDLRIVDDKNRPISLNGRHFCLYIDVVCFND